MPISHILAEGIGPFKKVHLDLRGPDGHPSLGPHILAGVNGSGKSTILKAIAWCLAGPQEEFADTNPRVLLIFEAGTRRYAVARTNARAGDQQGGLWSWANETMAGAGLNPTDFPLRKEADRKFNVASYSSARFEMLKDYRLKPVDSYSD